MRTIWNPWHGCRKVSEGCRNCYMFYLDRQRGLDGGEIYRTKAAFDYPLQKKRDGSYVVPGGSELMLCMTSDFFLEEADEWRGAVWDMIRERSDVLFRVITKRPERVLACLPPDFVSPADGLGWENMTLSVTCENQRRADERIPILLALPFRHKGIVCAPFIGQVSLRRHLEAAGNAIEEVSCGGENYDGARPCDCDWVRLLRTECEEFGVNFTFFETGTVFVKDGRKYHLPDKRVQSEMARRSGLSYHARDLCYRLTDRMGFPISEPSPFSPDGPVWRKRCAACRSRSTCRGCENCGKC